MEVKKYSAVDMCQDRMSVDFSKQGQFKPFNLWYIFGNKVRYVSLWAVSNRNTNFNESED